MQEPPAKRQRPSQVAGSRGVDANNRAAFVCPNACARGECRVREWIEVPRLRVSELTRSRFLAHAIRGVPFVLSTNEGSGSEERTLLEKDGDPMCAGGCAAAWGWPVADGRWSNLNYIRGLVDSSPHAVDEDAVLATYREWRRCSLSMVSAQQALGALSDRHAARSGQGENTAGTVASPHVLSEHPERLYLTGWEYDPPCTDEPPQSHSRLSDDVCSGRIPVMPCLLAAAEHPLAQAAAKGLRWQFIGEQGTSCTAHSDPFSSHAWMWLASGEKQWRILEAPSAHPSATQAAIADIADVSREGRLDLFDCESMVRAVGQRRMWHTLLCRNELLFVPSRCVHAVRNVASLTTAVSHNFVDVACLPAVLHALQGALLLLVSAEAKGTTRDEAQSILHEHLSGPMYALLSVAMSTPQTLERMVATALAELRSLIGGDLEKSACKAMNADCRDLDIEELASHMDSLLCLWKSTLATLESLTA